MVGRSGPLALSVGRPVWTFGSVGWSAGLDLWLCLLLGWPVPLALSVGRSVCTFSSVCWSAGLYLWLCRLVSLSVPKGLSVGRSVCIFGSVFLSFVFICGSVCWSVCLYLLICLSFHLFAFVFSWPSRFVLPYLSVSIGWPACRYLRDKLLF